MSKNKKKTYLAHFIVILCVIYNYHIYSQDIELSVILASHIDNLFTEPLGNDHIKNWNDFMNKVKDFIKNSRGVNKQNMDTFEILKNISSRFITIFNENYEKNIKPAIINEKKKNNGIPFKNDMIKNGKINEYYKILLQEIATKYILADKIKLSELKKTLFELNKNIKDINNINIMLQTNLNKNQQNLKIVKTEKENIALNMQKKILELLNKILTMEEIVLEKAHKEFKTVEIILPYLQKISQANNDAKKFIQKAQSSINVDQVIENYEGAIEIFKENEMIVEFLNTYNDLIKKLIHSDDLKQAKEYLLKAQQAQQAFPQSDQERTFFKNAQNELKKLETKLNQKMKEALKKTAEKKSLMPSKEPKIKDLKIIHESLERLTQSFKRLKLSLSNNY